MAATLVGDAKSFSLPKTTQTAGTPIVMFIPPVAKRRVKLLRVDYACGTTVHTLYILKALDFTRVTTTAAGAATSLTLNASPGVYGNTAQYGNITPRNGNRALAAGDIVFVQLADLTWYQLTISAVAAGTGTQVILTVSALPTGGVLAGAPVWWFGTLTDYDPHTGVVQPQLLAPTASATTSYDENGNSLAEGNRVGWPMVVYSNNATAAGTFNDVAGIYAKE